MKSSLMDHILFASTCSFALAGQALAQEAAEDDQGLAEIVVTANRVKSET